MIHRQIGVGKGLRFYSLRRVHHKHRALARRKRARNLIVKVHVAGGVDQVKDVGLAVFGTVVQANRTCLDGDATFPFDVHVVQNLVLHVTFCHRVGLFQNAVSKGGFSVVDVCDNTKIADVIHFHAVLFLSKLSFVDFSAQKRQTVCGASTGKAGLVYQHGEAAFFKAQDDPMGVAPHPG